MKITKSNVKISKNDSLTKFRPNLSTCVDYNISQTDTRLQAGFFTQLHIQQTDITFQLKSKSSFEKVVEKKHKYKRPPLEYIDEKWRRQQDALQEYNKNRLIEFIKGRKLYDLQQNRVGQAKIAGLVGPAWFMDLSPTQLQAVDNLKKSIQKDLKQNTVMNTKKCISILGPVLRPNSKIIEKSIKECCACPVEFLHLLFKLMKQNKKQYTLSDRLLLSAVVHLTMENTLRELHVRIPSPPREIPSKIETIPKINKTKYPSPYLIPFTFKPEPRKFQGIYVNKHIQKPESPYFGYLEELRKQQQKLLDCNESYIIQSVEDVKIVEELKLKQEEYNNLSKNAKKLLKPSLYLPCNNFRNRRPLEIPKPKNKKMVYLVNGIKITPSGSKVPILGGINKVPKVRPPKEPCLCKNDVEKVNVELFPKSELKVETENSNVPVFNYTGSNSEDISAEFPDFKSKCRLDSTAVLTSYKAEESTEDIQKEILTYVKKDLSDSSINKLGCRKLVEEILQKPLCMCTKCEEDRQKKITKFHERHPESSDHGQCKCFATYKNRVNTYEKYIRWIRTEKELKSKKNKFLISGIAMTPKGPICIVSGVMPDEEKKQITPPPPAIPLGKVKYEISGVKQTPDGNVYIISGAIPTNAQCNCTKIYDEFKDKHQACFNLFEKYLNKIKNHTQKYMDNLLSNNNNEQTDSSDNDDDTNEELINIHSISEEAEFLCSQDSTSDDSERLAGGCDSINKKCCNNKKIKPKMKRKVDTKQCQCFVIKSEEEFEQLDDELENIERIFLLAEYPKKTENQIDLIKRVLEGMARDGYPLAKLPDVHKLPHFKLWMKMRCGKFWTQDDRWAYVTKSKKMWNRISKIPRAIVHRDLQISQEEGNRLTWRQANYCRKLVKEFKDQYYRRKRQLQVKIGRSFFPTTFSYEFPSQIWRDCFFAYIPSKEEDVLNVQVWKTFEVKDYSKRKSCL